VYGSPFQDGAGVWQEITRLLSAEAIAILPKNLRNRQAEICAERARLSFVSPLALGPIDKTFLLE
jgi:hypothetical protein